MAPPAVNPLARLGSLLLLLVLVRPVGAGDNLLGGDVGFEAGLTGFHLRDGFASAPPMAVRVEQNAAEGRYGLRLGTSARPAVLEVPWRRLQPGLTYSFSAYLRTAAPGLPAELAVIPLQGEPEVAEFALSRDWRRYATEFIAAGGGWYRFEVRATEPERGAEVVVDGLKLERGEATAFESRPALAVELVGDRRLLRAGERVDWQLRLSVPDGGRFPLAWRLEDPFGAAVRTGMSTVAVTPGRAAEVAVRVNRIEPGAYRLVARAEVAGQELVADSSVVALTPQLGPPEPWIGVEGVVGQSGFDAVHLLRIGLLRGAVGPVGLDPLPAPVQRTLLVERRGGVAGFGYLPAGLDPDDVRSRVGELRDLIGTWELPPGAEDGLAPEAYAALLARTAAAAREAKPDIYLFLLRLAAADLPARLEALAAAGALDATSAVGLTAPPIPPERVGGVGLRETVESAAELASTEERRMPVAVIQEGWPAEPWSTTIPPAPLVGEGAARVDPLVQAQLLIRSILLARAGGAAGFFYRGAPLADRAERLTLAVPPTGDLYDFRGRPLPAVAALDQVLDHLRGRDLYATVPLGPETACLIWGGRRPLATIWQWHRPGETLDLRLPLAPSQVSVNDLFGRPVMLHGEREVTLELTDAPLYLESRVPATALIEALRNAEIRGLPALAVDLAALPGQVAVILRSLRGQPARGTIAWRDEIAPFTAGESPSLVRFSDPRIGLGESLEEVEVRLPGEPARTIRGRLQPVTASSPDAPRWQPIARLYAGFAPPWDPEDDSRGLAFAVLREGDGLTLRVDVPDERLVDGDRVEIWAVPNAFTGEVEHRVVAAGDGTRTADGYRVDVPLPPGTEGVPYGLEVAVHQVTPGEIPREMRWHEGARGAEGLQRFGWLLVE